MSAPPDPSRIEFIMENREESRRLRRACNLCAKSHLGCDGKRPCRRCIQRGCPLACKDNEAVTRKKKSTTKKTKRPSQSDDTSDESYQDESVLPDGGIMPQIRTFNVPMVSGIKRDASVPLAPDMISVNPYLKYHDLDTQIGKAALPLITDVVSPINPTPKHQAITEENLHPVIKREVLPPSSGMISDHIMTPPPVAPIKNQSTDNPVPSSNSIQFLLDHSEKTTADVYRKLITVEEDIRREIKSLREEVKQTYMQQNQIITTLSHLQKQLEGLFILRQQSNPTSVSIIEETADAVWEAKTLRLISQNMAFENLVTLDQNQEFYFKQLFPMFFLPIAESYINTINAITEESTCINQILAITTNTTGIIYVQMKGITQRNQNTQALEFKTSFRQIR